MKHLITCISYFYDDVSDYFSCAFGKTTILIEYGRDMLKLHFLYILTYQLVFKYDAVKITFDFLSRILFGPCILVEWIRRLHNNNKKREGFARVAANSTYLLTIRGGGGGGGDDGSEISVLPQQVQPHHHNHHHHQQQQHNDYNNNTKKTFITTTILKKAIQILGNPIYFLPIQICLIVMASLIIALFVINDDHTTKEAGYQLGKMCGRYITLPHLWYSHVNYIIKNHSEQTISFIRCIYEFVYNNFILKLMDRGQGNQQKGQHQQQQEEHVTHS